MLVISAHEVQENLPIVILAEHKSLSDWHLSPRAEAGTTVLSKEK